MTNVKLSKKYKNNETGDVIRISDEEATRLVKSGSARIATNLDFLMKPEFGTSKAFKGSPAKT